MKIKLTELSNYKLDVTGFGLCGYNRLDLDNGGYIYANQNYGNMETYVTLDDVITMLKEDGFDVSRQMAEIEMNQDDVVHYVHIDIW